MIRRQDNLKKSVEMFCIDEIVPAEHPLRKIEASVNWERVRRLAQGLYSQNRGRPGLDPVVLVKVALLCRLYGLPGIAQTLQEIRLNIAYRWFLGYNFSSSLPHLSTFGHNIKHRFGKDNFDKLIEDTLEEALSSSGLKASDFKKYT